MDSEFSVFLNLDMLPIKMLNLSMHPIVSVDLNKKFLSNATAIIMSNGFLHHDVAAFPFRVFILIVSRVLLLLLMRIFCSLNICMLNIVKSFENMQKPGTMKNQNSLLKTGHNLTIGQINSNMNIAIKTFNGSCKQCFLFKKGDHFLTIVLTTI